MGRDVKYLWKRMEGSRDGLNKGFSGKHVERISKRKQGNFIIFGKAARKNESRSRMIKQLKDTRSQRKKCEVYGSKAQGQSRADHGNREQPLRNVICYRKSDKRVTTGVDFSKDVLADVDVTRLEFYGYHHT